MNMNKYIRRLDRIINDENAEYLEDFNLYKLQSTWNKAKPHLIEMAEKAELYDGSRGKS